VLKHSGAPAATPEYALVFVMAAAVVGPVVAWTAAVMFSKHM
jgi:hypothetical protein